MSFKTIIAMHALFFILLVISTESARALTSAQIKKDRTAIKNSLELQKALGDLDIVSLPLQSAKLSNASDTFRSATYTVKTTQNSCEMTAKVFVRYKPNGDKRWRVHPCMTGAQMRSCMDADPDRKGYYSRLRSCNQVFNSLQEIKGVHYAIERNTLSGKTGFALTENSTCLAEEGCEIRYDDHRMSNVHLRFKWAQLNPEENSYDFSRVAQALTKISHLSKGKVSATLVVMTGKYTPSWLFEGRNAISTLGIPLSHYNTSDHSQPNIPLPWDKRYQSAYGTMMLSLSKHLKKIKKYEMIKMVKVAGIDIHSGEQRLMPVKAFKNLSDDESVVTKKLCRGWAKAGYRQFKIINASRRLAAHINYAFPDKLIGMAFVHGSARFPTISSSGACNSTEKNKTLAKMVQQLAQKYGRRLIVNSTTLQEKSDDIDFYKDVFDEGGNIGFQLYAQSVGCRKPDAPCSNSELRAAFQRGINLGALFVEVHDGNIENQKGIMKQYNRILSDQ